MVPKRALFSVSDKSGVAELAKALSAKGCEIVATGKTAKVIEEAGVKVVPIEAISGSPEAFQGRMKTLSFNVCGGILARRGDASDDADLKRLNIKPIDLVVVNFYPFEKASVEPNLSLKSLVEEIDIGGPTLVRAAAKNFPHVVALTNPSQYGSFLADLSKGAISEKLAEDCALDAFRLVHQYDQAIDRELHARMRGTRVALRYGENPHQSGRLEVSPNSPIDWKSLTPTELSYNNILDLTSAYSLISDLKDQFKSGTGVVIVKHNNPCGVAWVMDSKDGPSKGNAQLRGLEHAWAGDPVSAFGGVLCFSDPIEGPSLDYLSSRFVEAISAPDLASEGLREILLKRKNLKAVNIKRFHEVPAALEVSVPGGTLIQSRDHLDEPENLKSVTERAWNAADTMLGSFGILVAKALKSNAVVLVRMTEGVFQLVGAGQGQPNRIEAIEKLCIPRAKEVLAGAPIDSCVFVSDAFFPFRDSVETLAKYGIKKIVQPGGSIKDRDSIAAANELGVSMVFTGVRHFRH